MTGKTIGLEGRLYDYYAAYAYREPEILKELRAETARLGGLAQMQIGPEQGAFMAMLVKLTSELGVVVQLTVLDSDNSPSLVDKRLMPALYVDDGQTTYPHRDARRQPSSAIIWTPMCHRVGHRVQDR